MLSTTAYSKEHFSYEAMVKRLKNLDGMYVPNFPKKTQLNMPKLNLPKMKTASNAPKVNLPKLKKKNG